MTTYRTLAEDERQQVEAIFAASFNEKVPHAPTSVIVVAEENGLIVGLLAARLILHTEPLWVKEGANGAVIIPKLISRLKQILPDAGYAFATTKSIKIARLLERLGFVKQEYTTYRWIKGDQNG